MSDSKVGYKQIFLSRSHSIALMAVDERYDELQSPTDSSWIQIRKTTSKYGKVKLRLTISILYQLSSILAQGEL